MEVAKDGVVRIPKTVFETAPPAPVAQASSSSNASTSSNGKVTQVRRLDGTIEEVVTGLPPQNPNFAPRVCWPGGKIVTNDKLEVLLKFHERKGLPLTPEMVAKRAELDAAEAANPKPAKAPSAPANGKGKGKGKQKAVGKGKAKGGIITLGDAMSGGLKGNNNGKKGSAEAAVIEPPKVEKEVSDWYKNRPKGGVKVLGGVEGVVGGKRPAEGDANGAPPAKVAA